MGHKVSCLTVSPCTAGMIGDEPPPPPRPPKRTLNGELAREQRLWGLDVFCSGLWRGLVLFRNRVVGRRA